MTSLLEMTISCILLAISSEVISLLEVTVFLVEFACSTWGICVKGDGTESAYIAGTYAGRACIRSIDAIDYSRLHLQSFSILEVELFGTDWWVLLLRYNCTNTLFKLGTRIGVG